MRVIAYLLIFVTLLFSGCGKQTLLAPESFYYPKTVYVQPDSNEVFAEEIRETDGCPDLGAILDLYLLGPMNAGLRNPFPRDCQLVSWSVNGTQLELILTDEFAQLTGIHLVIACASLAKTCINLTDVTSVMIKTDTLLLDGDQFVIITKDNLLLSDSETIQAKID